MPLLETRGAASAKGFGLTASTTAANYIEDVFSTTLYAGTNSYRAVDVGVADLATKGALFWAKGRNTATFTENHKLYDTARAGAGGGGTLTCNPSLSTNDSALNNSGTSVTFNPTGTSLILNGSGEPNNSSVNYVGWTFREQPKFFDVVTFTTGSTLSSNRAISHNLGSVPGFIIVKSSSNDSNWLCYHRSLGQSSYVALQSINAQNTNQQWWTATAPTSTTFNLNETLLLNTNRTYVAYLFAHNAGGFGLSGTDNVITCGSFTAPSSSPTSINLGYEPQFLLYKAVSTADDWAIADNMRGFRGGSPTGQNNPVTLFPNSTSAEGTIGQFLYLEPTGFNVQPAVYSVGTTFIYIAIRRGPMKTPTTGTSVYNGITRTGTGANASVTGAGFPPDLALIKQRGTSGNASVWNDKLRGPNRELYSTNTDAEFNGSGGLNSFDQNGVSLGNNTGNMNDSGATYINWFMRRAPGFMDVVCGRANGSFFNTYQHNLGVVPELIISKDRDGASPWRVWCPLTGITSDTSLRLNTTEAATSQSYPINTVTSTSFYAATAETASATQVFYLFASCPGVSKVGSYTGDGTTGRVIDCGFTGGARFIMFKRTNATGSWFVFDTARGIVSGGEAALALNSTASESGLGTADCIDPSSVGFIVNQESNYNLNVSGGTYIFLAIA